MIAIIEKSGESLIKEKLSETSFSFKKVDLYNKTVYVLWGDNINIDLQNAIITKNGLALSLRDWKRDNTLVKVGNVLIGGKEIVVAAGPCSVESEEQIYDAAKIVKRNGGSILRGGAFKPRTSPYSFQGLREYGIQLLKKVKEEMDIPILTEFLDIENASKFYKDVDMIQVGSRNAQNFSFLNYLGKLKKPVLLKNGMGNSVIEWLSASEYVLSNGNGNVVLCYRGIKSSITETRFSFDIGAIVKAKRLSHLPLCADPSHPSGNREFVESMALAAVASGADMLEIEVHPEPDNALSDSEQQLTELEFRKLMEDIGRVASAVGRRIWNSK